MRSEVTSQKGPDRSLTALIDTTREQIRQGQISSALKNLSAIQKRSASDPEAKFAMGEILQELAELRAEQLQRVAPESAEAHELLGKSFESRGKLDEALKEYRDALGKAPNSPGLHFLIGNVDWKLRNLDAAEAEFKEELKLNPHHAMANLRLGQILLDTRRDEPMRAVAYLQEAASDAQSSFEAHRELGKALRLAHKYPEAVKELQWVEAQAPNDETVHAQLAALYKDTGDRERARQEIELHAKILRERLEASQKAQANQTR
ncbi:MAG: tetratricopeptide repeat protein [Acidobacteriota bacterium]|nr:tetratricopeptide repeat protein [Acidobacteriota bacterium]